MVSDHILFPVQVRFPGALNTDLADLSSNLVPCPLRLGYISATSRRISAVTSRPHLACISAASRLHLGRISSASPRISAVSRLPLGYISAHLGCLSAAGALPAHAVRAARPRSALLDRRRAVRPTSADITRQHPRSPQITPDHPRSPEITRDHPRSPEITPDHARSREITRDHARSLRQVRAGQLGRTPDRGARATCAAERRRPAQGRAAEMQPEMQPERQPRGSREAAERQPRGSREAAER